MASKGSHCLHETIQNPKKTVSSILQDLGRWGVGVIPVEIYSCTNKADWITKASMREEERRGSPKLQNLLVYLLQNHS